VVLLGISPRSADRLRADARACLHQELHEEDCLAWFGVACGRNFRFLWRDPARHVA